MLRLGGTMGDVVDFMPKGKYEVEYIKDGEKIVGVTHPKWPFRIMRNGNDVAMVCEETDEPFGILDGDVFNTLMICWLLIDDPSLIDQASIDYEKNSDALNTALQNLQCPECLSQQMALEQGVGWVCKKCNSGPYQIHTTGLRLAT
jgi:hypothetical protein